MNVKKIFLTRRIALCVIIMLFVSSSLFAQSFWISRDDNKNNLTLEWTKPFFDNNGFDNNDKVSFFSTSGFLSGTYIINMKLSIFGDLPFSHWEFKDGDGVDVQNPHTTIGNIYIGGIYKFPLKGKSFNSYLELGGRFPTMPESDFPHKRGGYTGFVNEVERREAFVYKTTAILAFYKILYEYNSDISIYVGLGGSYWMNSKNQFYDQRIDIAQEVKANFSINNYKLAMGFSGKYHTEGNDPFFENYNTTQVSTEFGRRFNMVNTLIFIQIPIQDTFYEFGIGLKLSKNF